MSRTSMKVLFSTLMILAFILSACQPAAPQEIIKTVVVEKEGETVVVTQVVEKTVEVQVAAPDRGASARQKDPLPHRRG